MTQPPHGTLTYLTIPEDDTEDPGNTEISVTAMPLFFFLFFFAVWVMPSEHAGRPYYVANNNHMESML